jgi:surface polysaccharide O-acyltransferase-like enzyme
MANTTSQHILNTSATLLGFCLFVITSYHIANKSETYLIDEFTSVVAVLLIFSCIFSFASIRTKNINAEKRNETIADYFFVAALLGILTIILLIAFNYLN